MTETPTDPPSSDEPRPWVRLLRMARASEQEALTEALRELDDAELIHDLGRLDASERGEILSALEPEDAAEFVGHLPEFHAAEAVEQLDPDEAADILDALESDERADLIAQLDIESVEAILESAAPETVESVRDLLQYPPDSAGGLMITEFVAAPASWTARELVDHLQANLEKYEHFVIQYVYILGTDGRLVGVLPLRDLVLAPRERRLEAMMLPEPVSIPASAALGSIFESFDHYRFLGIPVVDQAGVMVGVLLREDVDGARVDQAQADELKSRGIVGGEELRTMPLLRRSGRRLSWLSINIVLNLVAASVIAAYQDTLSAVIALAVFLPIISDMSGCSGNQAVAVSLRELSLGLVRPSEFLRVWWQEASVGALNGVILGLLIGVVAWYWQGNVALGMVVGSALALNTLVAVSIGGVVPLALRRAGFDPALASGPILTTVTDMCGFFLVLSLATAMLAQITGP